MSVVNIRVGYACINLEDKKNFRTFRLKTIEDEDIQKIKEVVQHNVILLGDTIFYNIKNNIYVYRAPAEIIPFIGNNKMQELLKKHKILEEPCMVKEFERIRQWQKQYGLRLSIHVNHFLILASPKEQVLQQSLAELRELLKLLKMINGDNIIIHMGGAYGDKEKTLKRFEEVINQYREELDFTALTVENDDKTYNAKEIAAVCQHLGLKWVYDIHHERCNPSPDTDIIEVLKAYPPDKYHLSSGIDGVYKPPHADYIFKEDVEALVEQIEKAGIHEADIMLEAKKKNLAMYEIMEPTGNGYWKLK